MLSKKKNPEQCIACYHCVKRQGVEVRSERIDRIFLEGHKLITMVISWDGKSVGVNVKTIISLNVFSVFF